MEPNSQGFILYPLLTWHDVEQMVAFLVIWDTMVLMRRQYHDVTQTELGMSTGGYKWHYYTVTLRILWSDCNVPAIGRQWMHILKTGLETNYSEWNETLQSQGLMLLCKF